MVICSVTLGLTISLIIQDLFEFYIPASIPGFILFVLGMDLLRLEKRFLNREE